MHSPDLPAVPRGSNTYLHAVLPVHHHQWLQWLDQLPGSTLQAVRNARSYDTLSAWATTGTFLGVSGADHSPAVSPATRVVNNCMFRLIAFVLLMTVSAAAFHDNTFAVFSLKEQLQERYVNMWELLHQLEYVTPAQREIVYEEIDQIRQEINSIIEQLVEHDRSQHP